MPARTDLTLWHNFITTVLTVLDAQNLVIYIEEIDRDAK